MYSMTRELLARRKPGHALERAFYCDPQVYQEDLEAIYYREWLFVTPACELPSRGSYVTYKVGAYQIVLVRDGEGEIRAFHNTCRHRGSVVCQGDKGKASTLVCPYHQWTYNLDGSLRKARDMGPEINPDALGLKPIHCRSLSGLIYICLAENPPDFEAFASVIRPYLAPHDLSNAKVAYESRIIIDGNWKLVWENNRECYHCAANHKSLIRSFPEDPRVSFLGENALPDFIAQHFEACEAAGLPARYRVPENGQYRMSRMPLVEGTKSFTMDGTFGVPGKRLGGIEKEDAGVCNKFHYPSNWAYFLPDHCMTFRVTPVSPTETELVTCWLVHPEAVEGVDYDITHLTEVWLATNEEDCHLVENNQRGVNSPAYEPGPYSSVHEASVRGFVDWYCETMGQRLPVLDRAAE